MKILVTGGAGFIGSHLVEELQNHLHATIVLDKALPKNRVVVDDCEVRPGVRVEYQEQPFDFCRLDPILALFQMQKPDVVCHLGAVPSVKQSIDDPLNTMNANVLGTYNVLEAARLTGVRRVVFISSGAVYGQIAFAYSGRLLSEDLSLQPLNPYALSKKFGEEMARLWASEEIFCPPSARSGGGGGLDTVSLRFSNVFGPRQKRDAAYASCIERFLWQWRDGKPLTIVPDGHQRRDMVYIKDVVRAVRLAAESTHRFGGNVINIGSGENYSILEIADLIGGKDYPREYIEERKGEIRETKFDISRAKVWLGWVPEVSFEEGIENLKKEPDNV